MQMLRRTVLALSLLLGLTLPVLAQQDAVHSIPHFRFEQGGELPELKLAYTTWGGLNEQRDNAILLTPGTSTLRTWPAPFVGPGKAFDPERWFVISVDAIGGGGSSKPADGLGPDFRRYNIRDMVRAQNHLVTEGLGIRKLLAVGGGSMGSFQGIEWGVTYPDMMRGLILWVPAARTDQRFAAVVDAMEATVTLDPAFREGRYGQDNPTEGLRRAGMVYFPWLSSDAYLTSLRDQTTYDRAKSLYGPSFARWDANSFLYRYRASRGHDVSIPYGGDMAKALARVQAEALVIAASSDRTIAGDLTAEMVQGLAHVSFNRLETAMGHISVIQPEGTPEYAAFNSLTRAFLERLSAR